MEWRKGGELNDAAAAAAAGLLYEGGGEGAE